MPSPEKPSVTVLMGVHNGRDWVEGAVDSILAQAGREFELLLIDDGSNDGSAEILEGYRRRDRRVRLLVNDSNLGLTRSLNLGLREARGDYIARHDADDLSAPGRLAAQADVLDKSSEITLVSSWCDLIDEEGRTFATIRPSADRKLMLQQFSSSDSPFPHGSVMFRRERILSAGGYDERFWFAQDFDLWLRLVGDSRHRFAVIPEVLYTLRRMPPTSAFKSTCQRRYAELAWQQYQVGERICFDDVRAWARPLTADAESATRVRMDHWLFLSLMALRHGERFLARRYARRTMAQGSIRERCRALWRIGLSLMPAAPALAMQERMALRQTSPGVLPRAR